MKLEIVLLGCNENPLYLEFWPFVHKAWEKIGVRPILILIADELPQNITYPEDIILFSPLTPEISTAWTAQVIRIFYPALISTDNAVIISDMDIVPLNRDYFHKSIENIDSDIFFCYRDILRHENMLPICYNAAVPKIWSQVTQIKTLDDLRQTMTTLYSKMNTWTTDQEELLRLVLSSQIKFIGKKDDMEPVFSRLDRADDGIKTSELSLQKQGKYCDYHMLRPHSENRERNQLLFDTFFYNGQESDKNFQNLYSASTAITPTVTITQTTPQTSGLSSTEIAVIIISSILLFILILLVGFMVRHYHTHHYTPKSSNFNL